MGLLTLTRLLQNRLFCNGCVARKKLISAYVQYALAQFFSCALPFGKDRLFAGGILVLTGPGAFKHGKYLNALTTAQRTPASEQCCVSLIPAVWAGAHALKAAFLLTFFQAKRCNLKIKIPGKPTLRRAGAHNRRPVRQRKCTPPHRQGRTRPWARCAVCR